MYLEVLVEGIVSLVEGIGVAQYMYARNHRLQCLHVGSAGHDVGVGEEYLGLGASTPVHDLVPQKPPHLYGGRVQVLQELGDLVHDNNVIIRSEESPSTRADDAV